MSGDVQPRRRRDKKKKKEEPIEETIQHQQPIPIPTPIIVNDDVNIHVHKESTLGGGICAKSIFFILMIAISVLIGFTITEHRGQTDVDIPTSESRFASIFEGWVDKSPDTHDDDDHHGHSEELSHEESEEQEEMAESEEEAEEEEVEVEESEEAPTEEEEEEEEEESAQDTEEDVSQDVDEEEEGEEEGSEEVTESQEEDQIAESEEEEEDVTQSNEGDEEDEEEAVDSERSEEDEEGSDEQNDEEEEETTSKEIKTEDVSEEKDTPDDEQEDSKEVANEQDDAEIPADDEVVELSAADSIKKIDNGAESESDDDKNAKSKAKSGAQNVAYEFENITNADDYLIRDELDNAQGNIMNNIQLALSLFTKILEKHPNSPRALYGTAQALDLWADKKRSNEVLQESIQYYTKVLNINSTPNILFSTVGERCINRMRFMGNYGRSIGVHKKLIERFPNESKYKNDLAVTYLTMNRIPEARSLLVDILKTWPNNGFALVHYGFILKTVDNELNKAVDYLMKGINTRESGVIDGRFYFHLGDALARLGRRDEAAKIYVDGVENKVFLSKYQRSLYNVDRLTGKPWWKKEQTPYTRLYQQLETHYREIRNEALAILNQKGYFKDESENLRDVGNWKQFELYARGSKHVENCKKCPITCKIIDSEPDVKNCRRGQVKFSVMHPGTHVWPHCGPTNCRLRIHLGLRVPPKTYIRVAEETRTWENGRIFIFDDSFEHEVWHNGTEVRLVLIVDVWHPELKKSEKYNLSAI